MKIKYSPNIIGCRIGDEIFLNPALEKGSKLYTALLLHEHKHSSGFTLKDLRQDFNNRELKRVKKEYYLFLIKHPRALLMFLPISKVGKYWGFDISLAIVWVFASIVFGVVIKII